MAPATKTVLACHAKLPVDCWRAIFAKSVHLHDAAVGWQAIRQLAETCKELLQCERDYLEELQQRCVERAPPLGSRLNYLPAIGRIHWGCVHSVWHEKVEKNPSVWYKMINGRVQRVERSELERMHASLQDETTEWQHCLTWDRPASWHQESTWDWAWRLLTEWAVFFDAGGRAALDAYAQHMETDGADDAEVDGARYAFDVQCKALSKLVEAASVARPARFSQFAVFWLLRGNPASWSIGKLECNADFMSTCTDLIESDYFHDHDSAGSRLLRLLCRRHPSEAEELLRRLLSNSDDGGTLNTFQLGWQLRTGRRISGVCALLAIWACLCEAHGRDDDADTLMGIMWASELIMRSEHRREEQATVTRAVHELHTLELSPDLKAKLDAWKAAFPAPADSTCETTARGAWPLGLFDSRGRILLELPRPLPKWLDAVRLGRSASTGRLQVQRSPFGLGAVHVARQCAAATETASVFVARAEAAAASLTSFSAAAAGAPRGADRKAAAAAAALKEAMASISASIAELTASLQPEPYQQLEYHRRTVLAPSSAGNELLRRLDVRYRLEAATSEVSDEELMPVSRALGLGTPKRSRQLELDDLRDWWEEATWLPDPSDSEDAMEESSEESSEGEP